MTQIEKMQAHVDSLEGYSPMETAISLFDRYQHKGVMLKAAIAYAIKCGASASEQAKIDRLTEERQTTPTRGNAQ